MKPEISIIVPVYNVEKYLCRCMESLLDQCISNYEIILIDDGSKDSSPQICDEYARKFDFIKVLHKENEGLGYARNSGISMAKGSYIAFIDSDDSVSNDHFLKLLNMAKKEHADVCLGGMTDIYEKSKVENMHPFAGKVFLKNQIMRELLPSMLGYDETGGNYSGMSVCRGIYRKEIFDIYDVKFHSEREYISEDALFNIDFLSHCNIVSVIEGAGYYYYHNSGTLTTRYNPSRFFQIKKFFLYEDELIKKWSNYEQLKNRIASMFIANLRVSIMQEVGHNSYNSKICRKNIKKIVFDECVQNVINEYDFSKMPIKQRIFCLAIKYKNVFLVRTMALFQYKKNEKKLF